MPVQLVCGIADERVKQRLFTETALKSQKAMDIASGMETAGKNMEAAHGTTSKLGETAIQVAKKLSHSEEGGVWKVGKDTLLQM